MSLKRQFIGFKTLFFKEIVRISLIWKQAVLSPVISTVLYFLIFGTFLGSRIGEVGGVDYMAFIIPGLIMMPAITTSYLHTSFAVFLPRFERAIEDILVSSMNHTAILLGYVLSGVFRGFLVSSLVLLVSLFFSPLQIHNFFILFLFIFLTSLLFSFIGFSTSLFSKNFDDVNMIPAFVLNPLTYLGGVFYSIDVLPPLWQTISQFNPILYMVNGFRYGFLGVSDVSVTFGIVMLVVLNVGLYFFNLHILKKGVGLRS